MLKRLSELPDGVEGLKALGKVTKDDFDEVIRPLLHNARRDGSRIRLLCEFGQEFNGFTTGAAWADARVGLLHLRLFERFAVVSEVRSIRERTHLVGALLPCAFRVFAERKPALDWLVAKISFHLSYQMIAESGVLVLEPIGPLRPEDFDAVAFIVDPWIVSHGVLRGLVLHVRQFAGCENVGGLIRQLQFVREHHRWVHRVAVVADGRIAQLAPKLAEYFVKAELRHFGHDELDTAVAWAGA